jgi:hypothetical protein
MRLAGERSWGAPGGSCGECSTSGSGACGGARSGAPHARPPLPPRRASRFARWPRRAAAAAAPPHGGADADARRSRRSCGSRAADAVAAAAFRGEGVSPTVSSSEPFVAAAEPAARQPEQPAAADAQRVVRAEDGAARVYTLNPRAQSRVSAALLAARPPGEAPPPPPPHGARPPRAPPPPGAPPPRPPRAFSGAYTPSSAPPGAPPAPRGAPGASAASASASASAAAAAADKPASASLLARIVETADTEEVLALFEACPSKFTPVNTSAALHRLGKHTQHKRCGPGGARALFADARWCKLLALADAQLPFMLPRNLSNSVWALATLRYDPGPEWVARFCGVASARSIRRFNEQQLANTAWSLAVLGYAPEEDWLRAFTAAAVARCGTFLPQHLSNILWALATLRWHPGADAMAALCGRARELLPAFNSQNVANTLFGLSRFSHTPACGLLDELVAATERRLHEFTPSEICGTLWAFSGLSYNPGAAWLAAFDATAATRLREFSAQGLSNSLLSFARLGHNPGREVLHSYGIAFRARLGEATPQALANTVFAYGQMHSCAKDAPPPVAPAFYSPPQPSPPTDILDAICAAAEPRLRDFKPGECSQIIWGLSQLGHDPGPRWRAAFVAATTEPSAGDACSAEGCGLERFLPQELSSTLYGFASLGVSPGHAWLDAWAAAAAPRWPLFEARHAVNALWSLTLLDAHGARGSVAAAALEGAAARLAAAAHDSLAAGAAPGELLPFAGWCAVHQSTLVLAAERPLRPAAGGAAAVGPLALPPACVTLAEQAWRAQAAFVTISSLQRQVSKTLFDGLGVTHSLEMLADNGYVSIDIAIEEQALAGLLPPPNAAAASTAPARALASRRSSRGRVSIAAGREDDDAAAAVVVPRRGVALEVDGPRHFLRNVQRPNGSTLLRNRLLSALGWRVLVVPYYEWPSGFDARVAYLKRLLAAPEPSEAAPDA